MNELISFLKLTQEELKYKLYLLLREKQMNPLFENGFIYAKGNIPILLVAHMDTVLDKPPQTILYHQELNRLYNPNGILGGDDRCGIYAIVRLLEKVRPHILFTEDEEIGCIGAIKAVEKINIPNVKYIVELDRRGKDDCVFYSCGNKKFIRYVEKFGFRTNYGTCSDISILGRVWDIAAVNLSCGYYNEHTVREFVNFDELLMTINRVDKMIQKIAKSPYFTYQEIKYESYYFAFDDNPNEFLDCIDTNKDNLYTKTKKLTLRKRLNNLLGGEDDN